MGRGSLLTTVLVLSGCPEDEETPGPIVCAMIDEQGGALTSDDGVLTISLRPGSLGEEEQVCIREAESPPDGPPMSFGTAYRVQPDINLEVAASITYQGTLPAQPVLGAILRQDFELGRGRWLPLEATRVEPDNDLISATDTKLSMYYGLLDASGDAGGATE
jgi:hypothetical protein